MVTPPGTTGLCQEFPFYSGWSSSPNFMSLLGLYSKQTRTQRDCAGPVDWGVELCVFFAQTLRHYLFCAVGAFCSSIPDLWQVHRALGTTMARGQSSPSGQMNGDRGQYINLVQ